MKAFVRGWLIVAAAGSCFVGCGKSNPRAPDPVLARFVVEKRTQAKELAALQTNEVPAEIWKFYDAVQRIDWPAATNRYQKLLRLSGRYYPRSQTPPAGGSRLWSLVREFLQSSWFRPAPAPTLHTEMWAPIMETFGACEQFEEWDSQWLHRFGADIIKAIPTNSIYFGGTDPGRFVISAMSESHRNGRPFFTLTQNALADGTYLDYLRLMYGGQIYIPTATDSQQAFQDYIADAQQRLRDGKLKPGEDVQVTGGRVQVRGQVAVMEINGRLAKVIFEKNPDREFYVEESFPLDWMYPHLEPHGLILKLNRAPLAELGGDVVRRDHEFWIGYVKEVIGDWLTDETPVKEVCDFAVNVYGKKDLSSFKGDVGFAQNQAAQKAFSKLRSATGGLYVWRANNAKTTAEKQRMENEADLAFRQSFALCPYSPEAVFRYINLLVARNRHSDALRIAQTCLSLDPKNDQVRGLVNQLEKTR